MKINFVWNKNGVLNSDGKAPIYISVCHGQARRWVKTDFYITAKEWDKARQLVKRPNPNAPQINNHLQETKYKFERRAEELQAAGDPYTVEDIVKEKPIFADFVEYCQKEAQRRKENGEIQKSQQNSYANVIEQIIKFGGHYIPFPKVDQVFVKGFQDYIVKSLKHLSTSSQRKYQTAFRVFVNQAAADGLLTKTINLKKLPLVKVHQDPRQALTAEQLKCLESVEIIDAQLHFYKDLFLFGCYTGLRFADLINLKDSDIKEDGQRVFIVLKQKKTKEFNKIPISEMFDGKALDLIRKYRKPHRETIFPSVTNQAINRGLKVLQQIEALHLGNIKNISFHVSRHTFVTQILERGGSLYTAKVLAGHRSIKTTQRYAHDALIDVSANLAAMNWD